MLHILETFYRIKCYKDYVSKIGTWSTDLQRPHYRQGVHIHLDINISVNSFFPLELYVLMHKHAHTRTSVGKHP